MHTAQVLAELSRMRHSLRKELDRSLSRSAGGWWIPSIAACVVWAWLSDYERKKRA